MLWHLAARGAATHDEMLEDVCCALRWVLASRATLAHAGPAAAPSSDSPPPPLPPLVFGGYSSGAHVAVSLLQRPQLLTAHGLPPPPELCAGVLLLSGVLGTRLTQPATSFLSPHLTDLVVTTAFGSAGAKALPSPVHEAERSPALPHLLLGCVHEVFGLPAVEAAFNDVMFCSRELAARLQARGVPAELIEVPSDHWFVLGSKELQAALRGALCERGWPATTAARATG